MIYIDEGDMLSWQEMALELWDEMDLWYDEKKRSWTPYRRTIEFAPRLFFGKLKTQISQVCREMLARTEDCVLVVPNELLFKRHQRLLHGDHKEKVWQSRPLDIAPQEESDWVREDVLKKRKKPLRASCCVVDHASLLSLDELKLLRSTDWMKYMELE